MSSVALLNGCSFECPHCGAKQRWSIDRYAVSGYTGETSRKENLCPCCHKNFYVEHIGKGEYWLDSDMYEDYDDEDDDAGKKW